MTISGIAGLVSKLVSHWGKLVSKIVSEYPLRPVTQLNDMLEVVVCFPGQVHFPV